MNETLALPITLEDEEPKDNEVLKDSTPRVGRKHMMYVVARYINSRVAPIEILHCERTRNDAIKWLSAEVERNPKISRPGHLRVAPIHVIKLSNGKWYRINSQSVFNNVAEFLDKQFPED